MDSQIGFHYSVSDDQLNQFSKWSVEEILTWLHETNKLVNAFQTEEEKNRKYIFKGNKYGIYTPGFQHKKD